MESKEDIKSIYLLLDFEDNRFTIREQRLVTQPVQKQFESVSRRVLEERKVKPMPGYVYYEIFKANSSVLYHGAFPDPTTSRIEYRSTEGIIKSEKLTQKKASYAVSVPYFAEAVRLRLTRVSYEMKTEDLGTAELRVDRR